MASPRQSAQTEHSPPSSYPGEAGPGFLRPSALSPPGGPPEAFPFPLSPRHLAVGLIDMGVVVGNHDDGQAVVLELCQQAVSEMVRKSRSISARELRADGADIATAAHG